MSAQDAPPAPRAPTPARQIAGSISDADYPAAAIRASEQGRTSMTIAIGADGMVIGCEVRETSGSQTLDEASCALLTQRFRFEPARDASGQPVRSTAARSVTWRLPEDGPGRGSFQSFQFAVTAELRGGAIASCSQQDGPGMTARPLPTEACAPILGPAPAGEGQQNGLSRITYWIAFIIAGEALPQPAPEWGTVLLRAEADVSFAADGSTARCEVTRHVRGDRGGKPLFGPTSDAAPREGHVIMATFGQRQAQRD
jgi:TonB family protein